MKKIASILLTVIMLVCMSGCGESAYATASLDVDNETEIQDAISHLIQGKTVLVIAHRMRTVENADKIIVLDGGTVAESGTHAELMQKNGLYARLVKLQTDSANWKL